MANYTVPNLGTAVQGFSTTDPNATQITSIDVDNTKPVQKNISIEVTETRPGWLTGRRPFLGHLFPRGVYNK